MIDQETIRKWWNVFVGDGNFTEVRILGRFQYSGYFKDVDALIKAIEPYSDIDDEQIYFVLNQIDDSCYGRQQCEKIVKSPKITTNDNDIVRRHWVLCDFDPVRKSGTNSSEEEFELAHKKAQDVFRFLRDRGFQDPVICKSGNGWHNLYYIDEEVSEETKEIIRGFFKYMGLQFTDDKVDFDEKNFNEARICKLYGTVAKKGANLPDRPWRMSEIVYVPENIAPTPLSKFKELADLVPKEEPKTPQNRRLYQGQSQFDLRTWLNEHGIVYKEEKQGASTRFTLEYCPWVDTHSDRKKWDSALFLAPDGQITFNCHHSHCKGKTWFEFRQFYEPDAYNRSAYQPQQQYQPRQYAPQKPKYEIKEEIPELGEKWKSMSSIKKVDITSLEKIKTGFTELDKRIGGIYMTEVIVLSGSNASGKSSWLNSLILNVINQGEKCALWSGELPDYILKAWIQMVAAGKQNLRQSQFEEGRYYVPDNIGAKIDEWMDGKFFLYNNEYGTEFEQIMSDMKILAKAGVKLFCLDNLMAMGLNFVDGDKNGKQKEVVLAIKRFAQEYNVAVILVAHPRKAMSFLRKNDISGTADLTNAVDGVWIFHRNNEDFQHAVTDFFGAAKANSLSIYGNILSVEKNRLFGVVDYMCGMHYEMESRRFKNTEYEEIHYAWEQDPVQQTIQFEQDFNEQYNGQQNDMPFYDSTDEAPPF